VPPHPRIPDFDVFATLGVTPEDPPEAIKAAYRRRVKEHHPDAAGGSDEEIKRINVAYDWLRDPTLRRTYLLATAQRRGPTLEWDARTGRASYPEAPVEWAPYPGADAEDSGYWDQQPPPFAADYDGPRAHRVAALTDRIATAGMPELVDLVHGYRPDMGWTLALVRGIETSGRRDLGAAAVWQVRRAVRERVQELLVSDEVRAVYDDELVGQAVSDRLADLVRGIVLLDVLMPQARARVAAEWTALMGIEAEPPGDEPGLGVAPGGLSRVGRSWSRAPDALRWVAALLAAAIFATAVYALLPSREAVAVIILGLAAAAVTLLRRRSPMR
jgi:hypothetical protein